MHIKVSSAKSTNPDFELDYAIFRGSYPPKNTVQNLITIILIRYMISIDVGCLEKSTCRPSIAQLYNFNL